MKIRSLVLGAGLAFAAASVTPSVASPRLMDGPYSAPPTGPGQVRNTLVSGTFPAACMCGSSAAFGTSNIVMWLGVTTVVGCAAARLLASITAGAVPLVSFHVQLGVPFSSGFNFGYWNDHYRDRPFFHERNKWSKAVMTATTGTKKSGDWKKQSDEPRARPSSRVRNGKRATTA